MERRVITGLVAVFESVMVAFGAAAQASDDSSALMLRAAEEFVASLDVEHHETRLFPFEQTRQADLLIASGMSRPGYQKTKVTMSLERVLFDIATAAGGNPFTELRNPDSYYFALYGRPSEMGVWGWRDYENDFGRDVLAEHYRTAHRSD